jgi:hypothetical protein
MSDNATIQAPARTDDPGGFEFSTLPFSSSRVRSSHLQHRLAEMAHRNLLVTDPARLTA